MSKLAISFIFLGFSILLIVLFLKNQESYSIKKYETEKELEIDVIDTNLKIPSSNPNEYIYFSDHRRRNQFNIGNEPQSPNQNINNNFTMQPLCGCADKNNL